MKIRIDAGNGKTVRITQSIGDIKAGYRMQDYSRISAYSGPSRGFHTGASSPTIGRHDINITRK